MFATIVCDRCSAMMHKIKTLRSVREVLNQSGNRCTYCGTLLNPADFMVKATRHNTIYYTNNGW
jgi:DNA-directed RNA polymerase subunit RPC12/RpoP